jgi:hypothetical protein
MPREKNAFVHEIAARRSFFLDLIGASHSTANISRLVSKYSRWLCVMPFIRITKSFQLPFVLILRVVFRASLFNSVAGQVDISEYYNESILELFYDYSL